MVCPLCGRKSEVGMFCQECYLKKNLKIDLPSVIEVFLCPKCLAYKVGSKWVKNLDEEDAVKRSVQEVLSTNMKGVEKSGLIKTALEKRETEYFVTANAVFSDATVEKKSIVRVKKCSCPDCNMISGGYYEAVIQFRGDVSKKTIEEVIDKVGKHKDKLAFVKEVKKVHGGFDIYLGSKKSAEKIVSGFRGKSEIKRSFEQYSFDSHSGKAKSRFYYLIRV